MRKWGFVILAVVIVLGIVSIALVSSIHQRLTSAVPMGLQVSGREPITPV